MPVTDPNNWLERLSAWLNTQPQEGVHVLRFPAYRPDLVRDVASHLGVTHVDFRERFMAPLKWDAARLTLSDLDAIIDRLLAEGDAVLLSNCEALLSLIPEEGRRRWLSGIFDRPLRGHLLLPLMLYAHETPLSHADRCFGLTAQELPEESLLDRLMGTHG